MKLPPIALCFSALAAAGTMLACLTGCEADSATEGLTVNPSSVTVKKGQTVEFTVSGGYEYTWRLEPDDGSGRLSRKTGDSTVYTCLDTNGTSPRRVFVTSTITGTSSAEGGSNTTPYSMEGSANIYYAKPSGAGDGGDPDDDPGDTNSTVMSISVSDTTLTTSQTATLTAVNAVSPFEWEVSGSPLGTLSTSGASPTTYTPTGVGVNTITLRDNAGHSASVIITTSTGGPPPPPVPGG